MSGWISLQRSMQSHWVFQESDLLKFWVALLMEANWETKTKLFNKKLITVERGQVIFGRKVWSERLSISETKLRRYIDMLVNDHMIDQQTTSQYSMITVLNYEKYQYNNQQTTSKQPAYDQQTTSERPHLNNLNKDNKLISVNKHTGRMARPTIDELIIEFDSRVIDPNQQAVSFLNHYESNGWKVGKNPMKSWKHAVTTWITRGKADAKGKQFSQPARQTRSERSDQAAREYIQKNRVLYGMEET